jgi:hypothetical protein
MVRIFIDDNLIAVPEPSVAKPIIGGRDAEIEAAKKETVPAPARQTEYMAWPESAIEVPVLPWMVKVISRIVPARIVPDPFTVRMNVWRFRMPRLVVKLSRRGLLVCLLMCRLCPRWGRTVRRRPAATHAMLAMFFAALCQGGNEK